MMNKLAATAYLALVVTGSSIFVAEARPAYAQKEGKQCVYCHTSGNGGRRGFRGQFYGANGLSFDHYNEEREAALAGVAKDVTGADTAPKTAFVGNISGPADKQIQLAALRGPVVVFFVDKATKEGKDALKQIHGLAEAYGRNVTFIGVSETDQDGALQLTADLGSSIRILPDVEKAALKKFSATTGYDFAVVAKQGDPLKTFEGISKANVDQAIKLLKDSQEVDIPTFDTSKLPETALRGGKL